MLSQVIVNAVYSSPIGAYGVAVCAIVALVRLARRAYTRQDKVTLALLAVPAIIVVSAALSYTL
jgi:hypothetical protein